MSVQWGTGMRLFYLVWFVFFGLGALACVFGQVMVGIQGEPEDAATFWGLLVLQPVFLAVPLIFLDRMRFGIWIDGHRLVRQSSLWRIAADLRTSRFSMRVTSWNYPKRYGPLSFARVTITAPTLVVHGSWWRRINVPLVGRYIEVTPSGHSVARWLPEAELAALADAIAEHATAPEREKVVTFLRNVGRSPVQPEVELGSVT